jgi:hypothetical protein
MTSGGARNRAGPPPDPESRTSERRGYFLTALPSEGYQRTPPAWPLGRSTADTAMVRRERQVWREAWKTPQACAWSMESWRWPVVAEYCRLKAIVEHDPSAKAALVTQLHRYRDQIGLTPAGLKENGWAIVRDELGAKRSEDDDDGEEPAVHERRKRRLRPAGAQ